MEIYNCPDYRDYLRFQIQQNEGKRGYLTQLAQAAGCQKSYLSLVVRGQTNFTPEHAVGSAQFWGLNTKESEYFLQLVHLGRAGTEALRKQLRAQLSALKEALKSMSGRFQESAVSDLDKQAFYYSQWLPAAIHVLVDIPEFRSVEAIAKRLSISTLEVRKCIEELVRIGLVKKSGGQFIQGSGHIHLPRASPFTSINHQNWRNRAVVSSQRAQADDLHYSSIQTLSKADFQEIHGQILRFIEKQRKTIAASPAEDIACLSVDWFSL